MRNALYIQSGGPTAVINASAYGTIMQCRECCPEIGKLYASEHGIAGVVKGELYDLSKESEESLKLLKSTPSMAFGSSRYEVDETQTEDYEKILSTLKKYQIRYLFINGGNGSVEASLRLYRYLLGREYSFRLIVIPKTVDNDIAGIDHSPGFPSAANHVVRTITELTHDMQTYDTDLIMAAEVMGRNTGYLAAATVAACETGYGPDLIYIPEYVFSPEQFIRDVRTVLDKKGKCFAVLSEGLKTDDGKYLFEDTTVNKGKDPSRNMGGITPYLNQLLRQHFDCKIRCIDLGLMQRCAARDASTVDIQEAEELARFAVRSVVDGATGAMVTLIRKSDRPYLTELKCVDLSSVAGRDRTMDLAYQTPDHHFIRRKYLDYILPLIDDLPVYASLKKVKAVPDAQ